MESERKEYKINPEVIAVRVQKVAAATIRAIETPQESVDHPLKCQDMLTSLQRPRDWNPMPVMLVTAGNDQAWEVARLLDDKGVFYTIAYVDTYVEPRLQVGEDELVGLTEIESHLTEIVELAKA